MRISPKYDVAGGVGDLWTELKRPQPYRWPILAASCVVPGLMLYVFASERWYAEPAAPEIVYITTFAPDRSEEEIIASNLENQERKEARQRLEEARIEKRREMYRALGQATGIDTDKMEAEIAEERAREEAEAQARLEEATGGSVDTSDTQ
ncbi:hypothetical protein AAG607_05820 [Citromicrobium bathyomarinum]|jgi:uncharacterized membrane protein YqiK|uniref:hypothetical protein n=1 Tax=Sphingomonadales TaxID=204457 RepID=UPI00315A6BE8|tara:strand:+ start:5927 stop:6379 length:453 start_codon:yes stop_codon:yes gene_type:complete